MEEHYLTVNGLRLCACRWQCTNPNAATVLALHGFTGDGQDYAPIIETTRNIFQWITLDMPGHGRTGSPKEKELYDSDALILYLRAVEQYFDLYHYHLLGYSMGGRAALHYALSFPARLASLVLVGTNPGLVDPDERFKRRRQEEALAEHILNSKVHSFIEKWLDQEILATQQNIAQPTRIQMLARRYQNNPVGLANSLLGFGTGVMPVLWPQLQTLRIPTLLTSGSMDLKYSVIARAMHRFMPHAERTQILGAGHTAHLEKPAHFGRLLEEFLVESGCLAA